MDQEDLAEEQLFEGQDEIGEDSIGLTEGEQWMSLDPWGSSWHVWFLATVLLVMLAYAARTFWVESKAASTLAITTVLPARMAQYTDVLKSKQNNKKHV